MGETSRQRWNRNQIPEMGSHDRLSLVFLKRECWVRHHRDPASGYRKTPNRWDHEDAKTT